MFDASTKFIPAGAAMFRVAAITAPDAITELKADIAAIEAALMHPGLSDFMRMKHMRNLAVKRAELARWERG
jgi:hypothetical protein